VHTSGEGDTVGAIVPSGVGDEDESAKRKRDEILPQGKKRRGNLPTRATYMMRQWLLRHEANP
jgi:hypothetical protein